MRIFEIIASCALPICDDHSFVKEAFGNSVLYIDMKAAPHLVAEQIIEHVVWIQSHPRQAAEMVREAHQIYSEKFCLESLLIETLKSLNLGNL
jgi:hypothetical protein